MMRTDAYINKPSTHSPLIVLLSARRSLPILLCSRLKGILCPGFSSIDLTVTISYPNPFDHYGLYGISVCCRPFLAPVTNCDRPIQQRSSSLPAAAAGDSVAWFKSARCRLSRFRSLPLLMRGASCRLYSPARVVCNPALLFIL